MYLTEVIKECDELYPNEYSLERKLGFCDELTAKLMAQYRRDYASVTITGSDAGQYLLPEDVTFDAIHSVRVGAKELAKENFTTYGVNFLYGARKRLAIPQSLRRTRDEIEVIYLKAPERTRVIDITGEFTFTSDGFYQSSTPIVEGDILKISGTINDTEFSTTVNVLDISIDGDLTTAFIDCGDNAFSVTGTGTAAIERVITEKTLCQSPYDDMYIQWVLAKICFYQRAYDSYNAHMTVFNQLLSDYAHFIKEREPSDDRTQWRNWL